MGRTSGILLHPTSLPSRFGIGDLGPEAYKFVDFLVEAGQSLWQVLPLGPTGYGDSPYASYSAFAGNTLLISPERLVDERLLDHADLEETPVGPVDYGYAHQHKTSLLGRAHERFRDADHPNLRSEFEAFCQQTHWLDDYALFRALKDEHAGAAWTEWDRVIGARQRLASQVEAQKFYQFLFFRQWSALRRYCHERGVKIIGDFPIFVAHDSADVWIHPELFKLDPNGKPLVVAGVPPDYFSSTGQFWGNPLYNWERMQSDGFTWWIERVRSIFEMVDVARADHFRGFAACWEIPGGDTTAERGEWVSAPGRELFNSIRLALGELPIIAEDLGVITPDVDALREELGFPGMRVLQFGFGGDPKTSVDLPHNYVPNVVAYTGTHDNDTAVGWFNSLAGEGSLRTAAQIAEQREFCLQYLNASGHEIHWDFMRAVWASVADRAIAPLQDVLGLGSEARMNIPNGKEGNWSWRFAPGALTNALAFRLRELSRLYGRELP
ncbi:MAG TPA: 4-alpha-glucanotransferase, partial [Pyrinomonadaceae bacterium]|nr:4-alpha-glucanotransferase [Pyrinomonadaceae bacterium]